MTSVRTLCGWTCLLAGVLLGCSREPRSTADSQVDAVDAIDASYPLTELDRLDISEMEPIVQEQIDAARRALQAEPQRARLNGRMGMLCDTYGQLDAASIFYNRACLLNPEAFRWHYLLGTLYQKLGEVDQAVATFTTASELKPNYLPVWIRLGQLHVQRRRTDDAEAAFARVVEAEARVAEAHAGLGRVALLRGETAAAVTFLSEALRLAPSAERHFALAQALRLNSQLEEAKGQETLARESDGGTAMPDPLMDALRNVQVGGKYELDEGLRLYKAGRLEEAVVRLEKALQSTPDLAALANFQLGVIRSKQGDAEAAITHYRAALKARPNDFRTLNNLGAELLKRGLFSEAMSFFRESLKYKPTHALARCNLGEALSRLGSTDEAIRNYRLAIENDAELALARSGLARALASQGHHAEAAVQWRGFLELRPQDLTGLIELATELARAGESAEAERVFDRAALLAPGDSRNAVRREQVLGGG